MRLICMAASLVLALTGTTVAAVAQEAQPRQEPQDSSEQKKPPTPEHTGLRALFRNLGDDYKHLWSADNAIAATAGGSLALAVHPFDSTFNIHLRSHYTLVNDIYAPAKYFGDTPEQVGMSLGA